MTTKVFAKRKTTVLLCMLLVLSMLAGCNGEKTGGESLTSDLEKGEITYPIETDETLTIWKAINAGVANQVSTEDELPFTQELFKRTGIKATYVHPPLGQEKEKFNIMLASGELPDIVEKTLSDTSEGVDGLIDGGYVRELSEDFLKDYAPNFWKEIQNDKELKKSVVSNSGRYYGFSAFAEEEFMMSFVGLIIRDDLLKDFGLSIPETIDEWHNVLTVFKNNGIENPFSFAGADSGVETVFGTAGAFSGAFGTKMDFFADNGVIKYGPLEDGYKEFLQTMNQWYKEGLLDKNFASAKGDELSSKMLNGEAGASFGLIGSSIGRWLSAKTDDEKFSLAAAPYPTLKKGDVAEFGYKDSKYYEPKMWISGTSRKAELAARFLDYGYSEEGHMFYNFGTEGETYEMIDGVPTYTDKILKNPDGLTSNEALVRFTHASYTGPCKMNKHFFKQQYPYAAQQEAVDVWVNTNAQAHYVSGITAMSAEDNSAFSAIMTDIKSLVNEKTTKYIMGIESLDTFDSFISRLKEMKIDEAIKIKQKAYDAFNNR